MNDTVMEHLIHLNTLITKKEKEYTKIIQNSFDKAEEIKKDDINIKINLIAIIYKKGDDYVFKFKIIKNNNNIDIKNFINEDSIYVYNNNYKINCKKFNQKFTDEMIYNNYLNDINKTNNLKILYTLSYIFNDIVYNISLNIPIIIILTNLNKLIMIDYIYNSNPDSTYNNIIDLTLLSIISKQLYTTITKYLKYNFEIELEDLLSNNINDQFNKDFDFIVENYRTSNNINEIINN